MTRARPAVRAALAFLALVALVGCSGGRSDDDASEKSSTTAPRTTSTTRASTSTTAAGSSTSSTSTTGPERPTTTAAAVSTTIPSVPHGTAVRVQVYFVRGVDLATGGAVVTGPAVGRNALEALLAGPTPAAAGAGLVSMIPDRTRLLDLDVSDGTATVDLSKEFTSGGGSTSMQLRVGQVVFTLTQFPTVQKVHILIGGREVEGIGGEGLPTTYTGRGAFADVTPAILPETPTPGQVVSSPFRVTGMSNTFEANLQYAVRTLDGRLLDQGSATATAGTGTWGTFSFSAEPTAYRGDVVITLWEPSMDGEGRQLNAYDVPIRLR